MGTNHLNRSDIHYQGTAYKVLRNYLPYFKNCRHILDFGCGVGNFLELCKQEGLQASGFDPNPHALKQCRVRGLDCSSEWPNLSQFDGMLMVCVIEHMQPAEVWRILAAFRGIIVIHSDEPREIWTPWRLKRSSFWDDFEHVRPYTPLALRSMLESHGFELIETGRAKYRVPLNSIKNVTKFIAEKYFDAVSKVTGVTSPHYAVARK